MRTTFFSLVLLVAVYGCGKMEVGEGGAVGIGTSRSFVSSPATATQLSKIQSLCSKLQQKDTNFVYYVNGYSRFNYDTTYKACDGAVTTATVAPTLSNNGGMLQFSLPPGQSLATSVETATSGQISQLCKGMNNLGYPHEPTASTALWYDTFTGSNCPSTDPDVLCVSIETGAKQADGSYKITSSDKYFLDFTAGQDSGMVIRHERYEQGGCAVSKNVVRTSLFKGIN